MIDPQEAEIALREARKWAAEGLLAPEALATIEARYGDAAARAPRADERVASLALYGVGGALLGAAAIALVILLEVGADEPYWLLGLGALLAAGAVALSRVAKNEPLADALLVAALVTLAAMVVTLAAGGEEVAGRQGLAVVGLLTPAALAWLRRGRRLVPFAAAVAFLSAAAPGAHALLNGTPLETDDSLAWGFESLVVAYFGAWLLAARATDPPWRAEVLAIGAVGLGIATAVLSVSVLEAAREGIHEIVVGAVMIAVLALGIVTREKGLVVGAAAVIAVDAVVFAFDVGGVLLGVSVLVATAAVMLWQAEVIRRFVREA